MYAFKSLGRENLNFIGQEKANCREIHQKVRGNYTAFTGCYNIPLQKLKWLSLFDTLCHYFDIKEKNKLKNHKTR